MSAEVTPDGEPGERLSWWRRHFEPGTGTVLLTVVAVLWALLTITASARAFVAGAFVLMFWGGILLVIVLFGMIIGGLRMREWNQAVILVPAVMMAGLLIAATPVPLLARFAVSAPGFASGVPAAGEAQPGPHWYGLYRVWGPEPIEGGYRYTDVDAWWGAGLSGVAYVPDREPDESLGGDGFVDPKFRHLWGPWYAFVAGR